METCSEGTAVLCALLLLVQLTAAQDLTVTIDVAYTSPADFDRPSVNDFRAGSGPVTLTCQVPAEGTTAPVSYQWTSTCGNCFASGSTPSVTQLFLRAGVDDGTHTCTATDSGGGETGSASFVMRIIGIGVFVFEYPHEDSSVPTGALPNNGIVVALGTRTSEDLTFAFQCRSGSRTDRSVRQFIGLDGQPRGTDGGLVVGFPGQPSAIVVHNQGRPDLSAGEEGVYTCRMLDENGDTVDANVGIYRNGFNTLPNIISLTFDPDSFTLTCTSTGSPPTTVTWMKDGSPLDIDGTTYSMEQTVTGRSTSTYANVLTIGDTSDNVAGNYICSVENALGSTSVELEVRTAVLTIPPLTVGEEADITCTSDLIMINLIQLEYNGLPVAINDGGQMVQLTLNPVNDSIHGGVFTCRAITTDGGQFTEFDNVMVNVPEPALSLTTEVSGEATAGQTYSLTCNVTEIIDGLTDSPAVEWLNDTGTVMDLSVADSGTSASQRITFNPLQTSHAGEHTCRATLDSPAVEGGTITMVAVQSVTVGIPAPEVSVVVPQGPLYTGTSLTLTCDITLSGSVNTAVDVSVVWSNSQGDISSTAERATVSNVTGTGPYQSTLTLSSLTASDSGDYTCTATADPLDSPFVTASSSSAVASISVEEYNISIISPPGPTAGQDYTLTCEVVVGEGIPTLQWTGPGGESILEQTGTSLDLTFSPLNTSHGGEYTCQSTVGVGAVERTASTNITAQIAIDTVVITSDPDRTLYTDETVTLTCSVLLSASVDTAVDVSVVWSGPQGDIMSTPERVTVSEVTGSGHGPYQSTLTLSSLTTSDSGLYNCTATADLRDSPFVTASSSSAAVDISVALPPPAVSISPDGPSTAGQPYSLTCTVLTASGLHSDPAIVWMDSSGVVDVDGDTDLFLSGSNSGGEYNVTLSFSPLRTSHGDVYTCMVTVINTIADVNFNNSATETVIVQIPDPTITFSASPLESPLYAGVNFNLDCNIELDSAVDTDVIVSTVWVETGVSITNDTGERITVLGPSKLGDLSYQTQLQFRPLSSSSREDDGDYVCVATITPSQDTNQYITGTESSSTRSIQVEDTPQPLVTITEDPSGTPSAGDTFNLTCAVEVVLGLSVVPEVAWVGPDSSEVVSGGDISVTGPNTVGNITTMGLSFSPLHTSHRGEYTCTADITNPLVDINSVTGSASSNVIVQIHDPVLSIAPDRSGDLYAGTNLTLTCSIDIHPQVDSAVTVTAVWTGPALNDTRVTTSDAYKAGQQMYESTAEISPLAGDDDGSYTCTATVTAAEDTEYILPATGNSDIDIVVLELPRPEVKIDGDTSPATAGSTRTLSCVTSVVEGLVVNPSVVWMYSDGNVVLSGDEITVGSPEVMGNTTTLTLTFSPLLTSHGGEYVCLASITIKEVSIEDLSSTAAVTVTVNSSLPMVDIREMNQRFAGVLFQLICTAELDMFNDLGELVTFTWFSSASAGTPLSDWTATNPSSCITVANSTKVGDRMFESTITFDPLNGGHVGEFTCEAVAWPQNSFVYASEDSDTYRLELEPELPPLSMTFIPDSRSLSRGERYEVTCLVESTGGLRTPPVIEWSEPTNSGSMGSQENSTDTFRRALVFDSVSVTGDDETEYTCTACIDITTCNGDVVIAGHCDSRVICLTTNTPEPVVLTCGGDSDSALQLSWTEPPVPTCRGQEESLAVVEYDVEVQNLKTMDSDNTQTLPSATFAYTVSDQEQGVPYNVCVTGLSVAGPGTPTCVPCFSRELVAGAIAIEDITVTRVSGSVIRVEWIPLTLVQARGFVLSYLVTYGPSGSRKRQITDSRTIAVAAKQPMVDIIGLNSNTDYAVTVAAVNGAGTGTSSDMIFVPAGKLSVTESFHCNVIVWEPPDTAGREITGYTVRIYYEVNRERTNDSTVTYDISNSKTNWLAPAALPAHRPLLYQVRALSSTGVRDWSDPSVLTDSSDCPLTECPEPPSPITRPGQIHLVQVVNRMAMWYPPDSTGGEISLYVVRVYYRSPRFRFKINIHYYTTERDWVALLDGPAERQLFMQVRAQNSAGAGPWSREVRVT